MKCFVRPPNSKVGKTAEKLFACHASWDINLLWFHGAPPDHVQVKNSSCCFPGKLVSFVHPRELVSLNPWYMTPPISTLT